MKNRSKDNIQTDVQRLKQKKKKKKRKTVNDLYDKLDKDQIFCIRVLRSTG